MSTIKHPVGPQSSKVYWRRRLVVGLGLLAALVIIFLIIVKPGASNGEPKRSAPPATDTASAAPTAPAATIPAQATEADGAACDPKKITVEAITDAVDYDPGQQPQFSVSITNTGKNACVLNAGTTQQVFTVTSGGDVYWTSTDCQTAPADAQVSLKPGVPISSTTPVPWDRTRSAPDTCQTQARESAPAGGASYHLSVSVAGIKSVSPKQFLLY